MKKTIFTTIAIGVLGVLACSNKKDPEPAPKSKTELLTAHPWKVGALIDIEGKDIVRDCEKDDIFIFNTDSTLKCDIGTKKCSAYNETSIFDWKISSDEKQIETFSDTAHINTFRIVILDENRFEFYDRDNTYLKLIK